MKTIFTVGEVAKICKVAPRTVSKWFDSGRLRGYRIPGSNEPRIPRENLIRFLKEHGMPLGALETEERRNENNYEDGGLTIPAITDPLGKHWRQPTTDEILIDEIYALMDQSTFEQLQVYNYSIPSAVYSGKMWCRYEQKGAFLCWFGELSSESTLWTFSREILII